MKLPKTIEIMGHTFTVEEYPDSIAVDESLGTGHFMSGMIALRNGMSDDVKLSTLFHEAIHMAARATSLEMSESQISIAAIAAVSVHRAFGEVT